MGRMEKKMETTILGYVGLRVYLTCLDLAAPLFQVAALPKMWENFTFAAMKQYIM